MNNLFEWQSMKKPLFFFSLILTLAGVIRVVQLEANGRPALVNMR